MSPQILLLRSREDNLSTARMLKQKGYHPILSPLFKTIPLLEASIPPAGGYIFTSQNAVRSFSLHLERGFSIPAKTNIYAVGEKTAQALKNLGIKKVEISKDGEGASLFQLIKQTVSPHTFLVHLSGEEVAFDIVGALQKEGFMALKHVLYKTIYSTEFTSTALNALKNQSLFGIFFYSSKTAKVFSSLIKEREFHSSLSQTYAVSLSIPISQDISWIPWRQSLISDQKSSESLIQKLTSLTK